MLALIGLVCVGTPLHASRQSEARLTSIGAVHAISNAEAARSIPVAFEGTVTYFEKGNVDLFVQEGGVAIYVQTPSGFEARIGDRVLVEGNTRASFRPEIVAQRVTIVSHRDPPQPVSASFDQLIKAELDCRRVIVRGVVHGANVISDGAAKSLLLDVLMPGGYIQAQVADGALRADLKSLLDSEVEITGAAAGKFDSKSQMTGVLLEVHSLADVRILKSPEVPAALLPIRSFDDILQASYVEDASKRVRVQGTITYYQPGSAVVIQDGGKTLWVDSLTEEPHAVGDGVVVSGFPSVRNGSVVLARGEIENTQSRSPVRPLTADAVQLGSGLNAFQLVSVEGQLIMQVREAVQDQYVIVSQGHVFSAIYRHPERGLSIPLLPMRNFRIGSKLRLTGICVLDRGDQFQGAVAFHLLLRSPQDVTQVAGPPLISIRNLGIVLGVLLVAVFIAIGRALLLERKLRKQHAATAASVERWRTRVIDGINKAIPLPETLVQITELLSFKHQSDFCWAEIGEEGTFGNCPPDALKKSVYVREHTIPARSGATLGTIYVGFHSSSRLRDVGPEELTNAARLAALAIETGSRYSDLVRRSEIDLLTNTHNRFAFERAIEGAIAEGTTTGGNFGLVYIDLDGFKQVNDEHGHSVGDQYLQEVTSRLRHQLRSDDILARIGGDEFAVILPSIQNIQEIGEVVTRLQSCFIAPFSLGNREIHGSASIGSALFPQDGMTRESLLESADVRMYAIKRQRRQPAPTSSSTKAFRGR